MGDSLPRTTPACPVPVPHGTRRTAVPFLTVPNGVEGNRRLGIVRVTKNLSDRPGSGPPRDATIPSGPLARMKKSTAPDPRPAIDLAAGAVRSNWRKGLESAAV